LYKNNKLTIKIIIFVLINLILQIILKDIMRNLEIVGIKDPKSSMQDKIVECPLNKLML
jgi:hypothetical protein